MTSGVSPTLRPPGGTMDLESPAYIRRKTDDMADALLTEGGVGITATIKGPRQTGKSSLLARVLHRSSSLGKRVVMVDFQTFDSASVASSTSFFKAFMGSIAAELDIVANIEKYWRQPLANPDICKSFLREQILPNAPKGLVLGMDETDRICECSFSRDFFSMLRVWHNHRALGFGKNLDLVLVTSTEPYLFIQNVDESPFNVGSILALQDFTPEQSAELNRAHGDPLSAVVAHEFYNLLSGHPYLTHVALYHAATGLTAPDELLDESNWESGPFSDHLSRFLFYLSENSFLRSSLHDVITWGKCNKDAYHRLWGMGLVTGSPSKARMRCSLYHRYYQAHLD